MCIRLFVVSAVLAVGLTSSTGAATAAPTASSSEKLPAKQLVRLHAQHAAALQTIRFHRDKAWRWQRLLGRPLSKSSDFRKIKGLGYRRWAANRWAELEAQLRLAFYQQKTSQLRSLMGLPPSPALRTLQASSLHTKRQNAWLWEKRAKREYRRTQNPPHKAQWFCIHRYEGAWNDPNSPYYGGLQMDLEFQQTYGPELLKAKGTADNWTPIEQMWVAERAHRSGRGFYPWPNTARYCGLI